MKSLMSLRLEEWSRQLFLYFDSWHDKLSMNSVKQTKLFLSFVVPFWKLNHLHEPLFFQLCLIWVLFQILLITHLQNTILTDDYCHLKDFQFNLWNEEETICCCS